MAAITRSASASPSVLHATVDQSLFPLKNVTDVVNFFRRSLEQSSLHGIEPDLTLLSIIAGYIELSLTTGEAAQVAAAAATAAEHNAAMTTTTTTTTLTGIAVGNIGLTAAANNDIIIGNSVPFPIVTHELVAGLYKKFQSILSVVEKPKPNRQATREIIKKVSDVIWNSLIRSSYKDRAHLQNLYSYLSGNKLDSFGVALAVVAGCQLLGYRDVRLAISEDHAWVVFGGKRVETIEVTWHGKGSEDKRGQDVHSGIESNSWLYLNGLPVVCDKYIEVAAIVSAINISLTANTDCVEVSELQQKLLWLLYDMGHLKKYPMGLGTLGELEEINPTHKAITCDQLYREAIQSAKDHYRNHHVYPYTYQGNFYNRLLKYREAFAAWANAADVIRLYTYSCRDDEEIYKELLDIANELIPYVMKTESSGHSARSILRDSEVFANLLRFYDGICQWEENSLTPILHIGWAKPLVNNITKFDYDIRSQVVIKLPEDHSLSVLTGNNTTVTGITTTTTTTNVGVQHKLPTTVSAIGNKEFVEATVAHNNEAKKEQQQQQSVAEGNNNLMFKKEEKYTLDAKKSEFPTTLADLTAACGEKILNPDFLLQGGDQPFADQKQHLKFNNNNNNNNNNNKLEAENGVIAVDNLQKSTELSNTDILLTNTTTSVIVTAGKETSGNNGISKEFKEPPLSSLTLLSTPLSLPNIASITDAITSASASSLTATISPPPPSLAIPPPPPPPPLLAPPPPPLLSPSVEDDPFEFMLKRPVITLYSQKMKGLKDLLLAEKLNTHAISLQVTAQSVASKKVRGVDKSVYGTAHLIAGNTLIPATTTVTTATGDATGGHHDTSIAASRPKRTRRE